MDLSATERVVSGSAAPVEVAAPWFVEQVEASRADADQLAQWTSSTVIDDNLQAPVFDETTFAWLHGGVAGYEFPIGHAGLMHTYGYLLSTAVTPYGLKRTRWLTADLAEAFGMTPSFFFPTASAVPLMERVASVVLPALHDPLGQDRTVLAFDEVIDSGRRMRTVYVADPETASSAVVYGLITGDREQIVSTFPVQPLTREWARGRVGEPTRYRYNYAPIDALPGSEFEGHTDVLLPDVLTPAR